MLKVLITSQQSGFGLPVPGMFEICTEKETVWFFGGSDAQRHILSQEYKQAVIQLQGHNNKIITIAKQHPKSERWGVTDDHRALHTGTLQECLDLFWCYL